MKTMQLGFTDPYPDFVEGITYQPGKIYEVEEFKALRLLDKGIAFTPPDQEKENAKETENAKPESSDSSSFSLLKLSVPQLQAVVDFAPAIKRVIDNALIMGVIPIALLATAFIGEYFKEHFANTQIYPAPVISERGQDFIDTLVAINIERRSEKEVADRRVR